MIRIMIIDDHPLIAGGIQMMLKDLDHVSIYATATTGAEALLFLENNEPEIILLDISLPDMDGLQLCDKIREKNKCSKIIGLTSSNDASIITQLLHRGANGYLLKNMERSELLEAIDKVMDGKVFLSKAANEKVLEQFTSLSGALHDIPTLTRREKEILQLLADGLNGPQIAEKLFLSPFTVETHRKKFNAKTTCKFYSPVIKNCKRKKIIGVKDNVGNISMLQVVRPCWNDRNKPVNWWRFFPCSNDNDRKVCKRIIQRLANHNNSHKFFFMR